jgi:hypothetical protein
MKICLILIVLFLGLPIHGDSVNTTLPRRTAVGRWRVRFDLPATGTRNLIINANEGGTASMSLLDAGRDDRLASINQPATWSVTADDRISFSGEIELPIGTCCRDTGTLMLKGKLTSDDNLSGKALFVTGTIDEENFNGFRSLVGNFSASRSGG